MVRIYGEDMMRNDLYCELYHLERTYWWHVGKRLIVSGLLEHYWNSQSTDRIVDIGCGAGLMLECLERYGVAMGIDISSDALGFCRNRGQERLCQADAVSLPFSSNSVSLVTALDVVEHLEQDGKALAEFHRILKPNGILALTVPAYEWLWSYWDEIHGHKRRYDLTDLSEKVNRAGFGVTKISYTNIFILPAAIAVRWLKRLQNNNANTQKSDFMHVPNLMNKIFVSLYRLEAALLKKTDAPFGLSIVCLARKEYSHQSKE